MTASFAKQFTLESPTKKLVAKKIDDERRSTSPDTVADESDLEELRKKFVGEVDLPESACSLFMLSRFY